MNIGENSLILNVDMQLYTYKLTWTTKPKWTICWL